MKSLKDYVSLLEGGQVEYGREELKSDDVCAKEAESVDPEDIDLDSDADEVEESCYNEVLSLETAFVASGIIEASCCEAYVTNPSSSNYSKMTVTMEASLKELWDKIKAFFKRIWNKVVSWFNKLKMYVFSIFMNGEKFIKKYKSEIEAKLSTLNSRELKYDGYLFSDKKADVALKSSSDLVKGIEKLINEAGKLKDLTVDEIKDKKKTLDEEFEDYSAEKVIEIYKDEIYGLKKIFKISPDVIRNELKFVLSDKSDLIKTVNEGSDNITNILRDSERAIKKIETDLKDNDEKSGVVREYCSSLTSAIGQYNTFNNASTRAIVSYANDRVSQAVALCRKVLGGSAAKESFEYNGSGSVLESVMNII